MRLAEVPGPVPGPCQVVLDVHHASRVVAPVRGAFAQRVLADVGALAEVPGPVDLATAAALPVAGVAALRALRRPVRSWVGGYWSPGPLGPA